MIVHALARSGTGLAKHTITRAPRWRPTQASDHPFIASKSQGTSTQRNRLASIMEDCNG